MNNKARINSILLAKTLGASITGISIFELSNLELLSIPTIELPTNLRLGHLAEKCVAELIKASSNYDLLYENIQIIQGNNTIGELDFIVQEIYSKKIIHVELAYKFYLFDPSISNDPINNWIGPNRNDSLAEKLDKLKQKQFPLLYHACAKTVFPEIEIDKVSQALCLLASLYVPYGYEGNFDGSRNQLEETGTFNDAISGFYVNFDTFQNLHNSTSTYHLPTKTTWGMDPAQHEIWSSLSEVEQKIQSSLKERRAVLVWQKKGEEYSSFFVVWW